MATTPSCIIARMKRAFSFLFAVLVCVTGAHAQAMVAEPPAEMKAIAGLLGEWEGVMKMTPPGTTESMDIKTVVSVKSFGAYQETVFTMDMPGDQKYTGHQFLTYDPASKMYKSWGFDDSVNEPLTSTGTWDGKKLAMTGEQGGMVTRITFEPKSKSDVGCKIEMKTGDTYVTLGECTYHRKG